MTERFVNPTEISKELSKLTNEHIPESYIIDWWFNKKDMVNFHKDSPNIDLNSLEPFVIELKELDLIVLAFRQKKE